MRVRPALDAAGTVVVLIALAALGTSLLYGHTLDYGFNYDDYVLVRPHSAGEVAQSFFGHWDPTGVMVPFYRPITVAFHALRFELFGLDSRAHHMVSLVLFASCAALAGWFARQITGQAAAGLLTTILFVAHPSMPYSLVAWITNQMHLIETLTVLLALTWWHAVRGRPAVWWLPLLAFGAIAFLIKEDGIMLLPVIVAAHWLNRRLREPHLARVPGSLVIGMVVLLTALVVLRASALGGLGGYSRPGLERAWQNYADGLTKTLRLIPAHRPWQGVASAFATMLPVVGLLSWRRASPESRTCLALGIAAIVLFNLPFVFVTKGEQMHLVATSAVLILAGGATALLQAVPHQVVRMIALTGIAAGIVACAAVARDITTDFAPFGPIVMANDDIVRGWSPVPAQVQEYLARKRQPGAPQHLSPNPVDELSHAIFGVHGVETGPDGVRYQWMSQPTAEILVLKRARAVTVPLRHEIGAFLEPASVAITLDGRPVDRLRLDDGNWRPSTIRLPIAGGGWRAPRIRISLDHVWYPARIIPSSNDPRALGLQIGEIALQ